MTYQIQNHNGGTFQLQTESHAFELSLMVNNVVQKMR